MRRDGHPHPLLKVLQVCVDVLRGRAERIVAVQTTRQGVNGSTTCPTKVNKHRTANKVQGEKGGGLCIEPAPHHIKTNLATETLTKDSDMQAMGEQSRVAAAILSRDESREEAPVPTLSLAAPKQNVRITAWNVRTMYESGKTAQVTREMRPRADKYDQVQGQ